jgi:hypothetical protein
MSLHFQVYADFSLTMGKPQLVNLSISSTHAACSHFPFCPLDYSYLTISRIFPTLKIAHSYIAYLQGIYPQNPAPPPVLDSGQIELF